MAALRPTQQTLQQFGVFLTVTRFAFVCLLGAQVGDVQTGGSAKRILGIFCLWSKVNSLPNCGFCQQEQTKYLEICASIMGQSPNVKK